MGSGELNRDCSQTYWGASLNSGTVDGNESHNSLFFKDMWEAPPLSKCLNSGAVDGLT